MDGDAEMHDQDGDEMMDDQNRNNDRQRGRGNRLSDQVAEMDDEPALQGYERYVYFMIWIPCLLFMEIY